MKSDGNSQAVDRVRRADLPLVPFGETLTLPDSLYSATLRLLGASERLLSADADSRVILVSSARPGEGKTFAAMAFARAVAQIGGSSVLLVDGNFERPALNREYGLPDVAGFGLCLARRRFDPTLAVSVAPHLAVLSAGRQPQPGLLFQSSAVRDVLATMRNQYGTIVVDAGPIATVGALGRWADGIVLVVDASRTRREVIRGTLRQAGIPPSQYLGVVLNRRPTYVPDGLYNRL